jgi:hypothetical protein
MRRTNKLNLEQARRCVAKLLGVTTSSATMRTLSRFPLLRRFGRSGVVVNASVIVTIPLRCRGGA